MKTPRDRDVTPWKLLGSSRGEWRINGGRILPRTNSRTSRALSQVIRGVEQASSADGEGRRRHI